MSSKNEKDSKTESRSPRRKREGSSKGFGEILMDLDSEQTIVTEGGERKRMPRVEVEYRLMFNRALKGDLKAAREIITLAKDYRVTGWDRPTKFVVVPNKVSNQRSKK